MSSPCTSSREEASTRADSSPAKNHPIHLRAVAGAMLRSLSETVQVNTRYNLLNLLNQLMCGGRRKAKGIVQVVSCSQCRLTPAALFGNSQQALRRLVTANSCSVAPQPVYRKVRGAGFQHGCAEQQLQRRPACQLKLERQGLFGGFAESPSPVGR